MSTLRIVRIAANREKQIIEQVEKRLALAKLDKSVMRIIAPVERIEKIVNGKKRVTTKSIYPGYMYIDILPGCTNEHLDILRTSKYVHGIDYVELRPAEIENILKHTDEYQEKETVSDEKYLVGETVKIIDGPFSNFIGKVSEYKEDKKRLKVIVFIFGKETSMELKTSQVAKYS